MHVFIKTIINVSFFGLLLILSSCGGNLNIYSVDEDIAIGQQYYTSIESGAAGKILDEKEFPEAYKKVNAIVKEITSSNSVIHKNEFDWKVTILDNDTVLNAFATPGGYVYVYTGLIKYLDSEDQLAGVLGHEIAHADLRHSTEQLTKSYGIGLILRYVFGGSGASDVAASLVGLQFSRSDETEADMQSVVYLYDTKYDPRGAARFFEKMEAKGETLGPLVFLSTHPNPENRVQKIYNKWKELGSKTGETNTKEYEELKKMLD
jgi:beta-barrel assembly-enhancing protease